MTAVLFMTGIDCYERVNHVNLDLVDAETPVMIRRIHKSLACFDIGLFISSLVLAILGTIQVIQMPAAAFGSLYAIAGLTGSAWLGHFIYNRVHAQAISHKID